MRFNKSNRGKPKQDGKVLAKDKVRSKGLLKGKKVLVYVPSLTGQLDLLFVEGFTALMQDCWEWKKKGWEFYNVFGRRMFIQHARNIAVDHAIENDIDYILYIDDDMMMKTDEHLFTKLVEHDKDIVAPLFFHKVPPYCPLIFRRSIYGNGEYTDYKHILDYKKGLVEVDATGCGVVLIKTEVFKNLEKPYFLYGDTFGEDLYFMNKAKAKGYSVFCDTNIEVGHIGNPYVSFEGSFLSNKDAAKLYVKQKEENAIKSAEERLSVGKDTDKKVSVILTSYNKPEYIKNAIETVLHQSYPNFELLIMDDNSDDKVKEFIKSFNDPRIKTYFSDVTEEDRYKKTRYSVLINKALEMATGDYITYLTDDSWYYPNRLEVMVNQLNKNGTSICYGGQNIFQDNKKKKKLELIEDRKPTEVTNDISFKADHCSVMHKKEVTDKYKWEEDPKAWRHGDAYFFKAVGKEYEFHPVKAILDASIRHDKSIMHQLDMDGDLYKIDRSKIEVP